MVSEQWEQVEVWEGRRRVSVQLVVEVRTRVDGRVVEVDVAVVPGVVVSGALSVAAWALLWVPDPPCWHRSVVDLVEPN